MQNVQETINGNIGGNTSGMLITKKRPAKLKKQQEIFVKSQMASSLREQKLRKKNLEKDKKVKKLAARVSCFRESDGEKNYTCSPQMQVYKLDRVVKASQKRLFDQEEENCDLKRQKVVALEESRRVVLEKDYTIEQISGEREQLANQRDELAQRLQTGTQVSQTTIAQISGEREDLANQRDELAERLQTETQISQTTIAQLQQQVQLAKARALEERRMRELAEVRALEERQKRMEERQMRELAEVRALEERQKRGLAEARAHEERKMRQTAESHNDLHRQKMQADSQLIEELLSNRLDADEPLVDDLDDDVPVSSPDSGFSSDESSEDS